MACYKSALIDLDRRWANKGQDMIDNSVDYRGFKVDKMALECDKEMVDEFIDKLYQPDRLRRVDTCKELPDSLNWCDPTTSEAIVGSANIDEIAESSRND